MVERIRRCKDDNSPAGPAYVSLPYHCHIVETGNESYRLQHSSLAAQSKIKSHERKRQGDNDTLVDDPF